MKKIFAFVLATIMVLSLVPASAFAAITKADCSNGHKDPVKIGGQAATCEKSGYTIYKCNDCGETYVADPVEKLEHNWVSNPALAHNDIKASCVYKTDGIRFVICKDCKVTETLEVHWESTSVHTYKYVSGLGCEKLYACTTCKAEGYIVYSETYKDEILVEEVKHNWKYDYIVEEPYWSNGEAKNGLAHYVCAVEDCVAFKDVPIECPPCACPAKDDKMVLVKAPVAATCTEDGTYAVYQCADCNALYVDYARDNDPNKVVYEVLTDVNADKKVSADDAIILASGHVPPSSYAKTGCTRTYTCLVCKQAVNEIYHDPAKVATSVSLPATCLTMGISYKTCTDCRTQWTEIVDPLGHEESESPIIVASNCAVNGGKYTYCTRKNCPLSETTLYDLNTFVDGDVAKGYVVVGKYKVVSVEAFPLDASKHKKVDTNAANAGTQTCTTAQLSIWVCNNKCADYATPVIEYKAAKGHDLRVYKTLHNCMSLSLGHDLPIWTSRTIMICDTCGLTSEQIIDPYTLKNTNVDVQDTTGTIKNTFANVNEMLEYHGILTRVWGYNDDDELVVQGVEYRKNKLGVEWTADTWLTTTTNTNGALHLINSVPATCMNEGIDTYYCAECNVYAYVTNGKLKHNASIIGSSVEAGLKIPGFAATCNTAGIRDSYTCLECSTTYYYNGPATADNQKTGSLVINPCGSTLYDSNNDGKPDAKRDCQSSRGTKYYECTVCGTCYTSAACTSKYVPSGHVWKNAYAGVAATCNSDGVLQVRYCNVCKRVEINAIYTIDGEEVIKNFGSKDNYWKKNSSSFSATIGAPYVSNTVKVSVHKKTGAVTFLCDTVTTSTCPVVVNKIDHYNPNGGLHTHNADCEDDCAQVWAKSYVTTEQNWDETSDHTEAEFTKSLCSACDYEIISNYAPAAAGHTNAKGELLGNDCETGTVISDRVCDLCVKAGKTELQATIPDGHNFELVTDSSKAEPTCSTAGYKAWQCTKCGAFDVSDEVKPADAKAYHAKIAAFAPYFDYLSPKELAEKNLTIVGQKEDYAHDGSYYWACALCGYQYTKATEEKCPGVGVELTLKADAASYATGSSIFLTVNIDSLKGVEVWGLNFNVDYDPSMVKFVGYQTIDASGFTGTAHSPVVAVLRDNGAIEYESSRNVNVALSNANGIEIKGETSVIVLEFKVMNADATNKATEFAVGDYDNGTAVLSTVVVGANGKKIESFANDLTYTRVGLKAFADLDNDGATTMFDAFELYYLILTDGYNAIADINGKDGVNVDDLNMLYDYIIGKITIDEILNPKEEEKERVIEYDKETGEVIYDSLCDFNENGKIDTVSELAALSGRIDPNLFW